MFGTNTPTQKRLHNSVPTIYVHEIFATIQGEGPFAGEPAVFVRLTGCNLQCKWCDTDFDAVQYALEPDRLTDVILTTPDIERTKGCGGLVVITGGEPLLQPIEPLVRTLYETGIDVQIETAGTVWRDVAAYATLVCSPKTHAVNSRLVWDCEHWKYIVAEDDADPDDGLPVLPTQPSATTPRRVYRARHGTIWVQPRFDYIEGDIARPDIERNRRNTAHAARIAMRYGYRLSLQTHRIIGLP